MSASDVMKTLASVIGDNEDEATVTKFLDSGFPPLNDASSANWDNGFPVGRLVEIAGPPSSGKTAIATKVMIAAQKAGGVAGFMDHEHSFSSKLATNMGLDTSHGWVYKKPDTFEKSVAIFNKAVAYIRENKLIASDAPIVWVFDSLAAMIPRSTLYDEKGELRDPEKLNMNDHTALARATSTHFKAIALMAEKYDVCVIFLNQLRAKIGVIFGDPRTTTGGSSPEFYFSQRLWLTARQIKKKNQNVPLGMEITGKFVKNKISAPFREATWRFVFQEDGSGRFDVERSLIDYLEENQLIESSGARGSVKFEGKSINKDVLARQIEAEGPAGFAKLKALLPARQTAQIVGSFEVNTSDEKT